MTCSCCVCPVHGVEHDGTVACKDCGKAVAVKHYDDGEVQALCEGCETKRHVAFWKRIGVR